MNVFISHSSAEAKLAARIEQVLEGDGLRAWLDRSDIRLGRLLRSELQRAIVDSRVVVLLWSKAAATSRWVAGEILTAFHSDRFVIVCASDATRPPYFLENTITLPVRLRKADWAGPLIRSIREAPQSANELPRRIGAQPAPLRAALEHLASGQRAVLDMLGRGDLAAAKQQQARLDSATRAAAREWRLEAEVQNLAGYHTKNAYMIKHWAAIQAARPPKDRLLERAERFFFDTLFVDPNNIGALNGIGNVLYFEGDLEAAEFFIRRALVLGQEAGIDYAAAQHDLQLVLASLGRS